MTPPRLEACYFGPDMQGQWSLMARVLAHTAAVHCPDWQRSIRSIRPSKVRLEYGAPGQRANTEKLMHWNQIVQLAADGDRLLLIDVDTMILRPLDDVWTSDFDVAYTVRKGFFAPFNAGVIFLRVSNLVQRFMQAWTDENLNLLRRPQQPWRKTYGGVNQASLAQVLDGSPDLRIHKLPCAIWNCEDSSWSQFDPAVTRIVHIKSDLRRAIFDKREPAGALKALVAAWDAVTAQQARSA